jgi:hypothetical protein
MKYLKIQTDTARPVIDILFAREIPDSDYCLLSFDDNKNTHYFAGHEEDHKVIKIVLDEKGILNEEIGEDSLKKINPTKRYSLFGNGRLMPFSITGL